MAVTVCGEWRVVVLTTAIAQMERAPQQVPRLGPNAGRYFHNVLSCFTTIGNCHTCNLSKTVIRRAITNPSERNHCLVLEKAAGSNNVTVGNRCPTQGWDPRQKFEAEAPFRLACCIVLRQRSDCCDRRLNDDGVSARALG